MRERVSWRSPWLPDGNDPTAIPVIVLLFYEFAFIAWVFAFLLFAVATELGHTNTSTADQGLYPLLGFFGGALPMFAAYAISTNRRYAAQLSIVAMTGILFCVGVIVDWPNAGLVFKTVSLCAALGFAAYSGWVIFLARKYRSRWRRRLDAGKTGADADRVFPRTNAFLKRWDIMSFLEHLVLLVVLVALFGGLFLMQRQFGGISS